MRLLLFKQGAKVKKYLRIELPESLKNHVFYMLSMICIINACFSVGKI